MIIYLVRHGKDDDNYRGGWSKLGLVEEGRNQSKVLAEYLYNNRDKYNINTLISSDLRRAVETTNEISVKLNVPIKFCDLSNTGIHTIEYISGDWKITDSNDIEHLNNLVD